VPTYEYHCDGCGRDFEVKQRITEDALKTCDVCGGAVRRLLSGAPFILKGEGWYVTDYPSASRKKAMEVGQGQCQERRLERQARRREVHVLVERRDIIR
jgi:putative FmdB family regulatory protein